MKINLSNRMKVVLITAGLFVVGFFVFTSGQKPTASAYAVPELPRTYVDSSYPVLSSTRKIRNVKSTCTSTETLCYTSLQTAIDQALLGDEIIVQAGMAITGPIVLKNKTSGSGWIIIRTSDMAGLPPAGNRVGPINAGSMPKIEAPGSNLLALSVENMAHNYRLVGIEIREKAPNSDSNVLVQLGPTGSFCATSTEPYKICDPSVLSNYPYNLVLDRVYIHGSSTANVKRGVGLDSKAAAIIDSYISDIHVDGQDSQAIAGLYGPGPYKIANNYLEASSENIIFGGDVPRVYGLIPSDIEIRNNYITKPLSWRTLTTPNWSIKNLVEMKNAQRVLVDGNIIENTWVDSQTGLLILLTPRNSGSCRTCGATWAVVQNITFTNNVIRHGAGGVQILGYDKMANDGTDLAGSGQARDILFRDNIFYDINKSWGSSYFWGMYDRPANITFDHNTIVNAGGNSADFDSTRTDGTYDTVLGLTIINNIWLRSSYGIKGGGVGEGKAALGPYAPGYVYSKNLFGSDTSIASSYPASDCPTTCYPNVATWQSQFTNYTSAIGGNLSDFTLRSDSVYRSAATDGSDIGARVDRVVSATKYVVSGSVTGAATPIAGDLNLDHIVNALDFSILNSHWYTSDPDSDLNHDGLVNSLDASILNNNWFKTW